MKTNHHERLPELDKIRLGQALEKGNVPTLLMVLFQLTGDQRWLQDPYCPTKIRSMGEHRSGGLADSVQSEIRKETVRAMVDWQAGKEPAYPTINAGLLLKMMSVSVGEPIPPEYETMIGEEMGFIADQLKDSGERSSKFSVIVIGGGVSGLAACHALREAGISHTLLEKSGGLAGTWHDNSYPGAGVDTPSYLYALSYFPRNWKNHFAKRDELVQYCEDMADQLGLMPSIRLNTEVVSAQFDETQQIWIVITKNAEGKIVELKANAVISAVGIFNPPSIPEVPGIDLHGESRPLVVHSARWPKNLDLAGKRVAIIGTGATAMQIVPAIADKVRELVVLQRTAQWFAPNEEYLQEVGSDVHWLMDNIPFYHSWYRFRLAWTFNDKVYPSLQIDPEWPHRSRSINSKNESYRTFYTQYINQKLEGRPDLLAKAIPAYPPFGKRMLLDARWLDTVKKPNVKLVEGSLAAITEAGFKTTDGHEHEVDVIVLCTGFKVQTMISSVNFIGRNGQRLRDAWNGDDAKAHLGMTIPGFPNLFIMYGPNTNPAGGSYTYVAECSARYIAQAISTMIDKDLTVLECRSEVFKEFNLKVDATHSRMIWSHPETSTYYRNSKGRVVTNWPWRMVDYWQATRQFKLSDFTPSMAVMKEQTVNGT